MKKVKINVEVEIAIRNKHLEICSNNCMFYGAFLQCDLFHTKRTQLSYGLLRCKQCLEATG